MTETGTQAELTRSTALLDADGNLVQVGWARQPLLDCNLENVRFYRVRPFQRFRVKRWDYYGVATPTCFFSVTLADLGYAGQAFVYQADLKTGDYHEETLTSPWGGGSACRETAPRERASLIMERITCSSKWSRTAGACQFIGRDSTGRGCRASYFCICCPSMNP